MQRHETVVSFKRRPTEKVTTMPTGVHAVFETVGARMDWPKRTRHDTTKLILRIAHSDLPVVCKAIEKGGRREHVVKFVRNQPNKGA